MRVNARLDAESTRQLEYLLEATGVGVSDVLKASLAHYCAAVRASRPPALSRLRPWIGTLGSGRSDVSVRSKELLQESLTAKLRPRARTATRARSRG
jgi:hypothetical protein